MRRLILVALPALALFDLLGSLANGDNELTRFDRWISARCEAWTEGSPWVAELFRPITSFGDANFLILVAWLTVLALTLGARRRLALAWLLAATGAWQLNAQLKLWYARPRPQFAHPLVVVANDSFPSGHTLGSAVVYGLLAYWLLRSLRRRLDRALAVGGLGLLVLAVAVSRVVLGAHWPSDVAAAVLVGCIWLTVCVPILNAVDVEGRSQAAKTE